MTETSNHSAQRLPENPFPDRVDGSASAVPPAALARSRGTDFFWVEDLLDTRERDLLHRVREFCDHTVAPVANDYWERAELPVPLIEGYSKLGVAGGALIGPGCPGLSPLAEGMISAELARGDGSIATFNAVHSGLAMTTVALLGSDEQRERWLPSMAAVESIGAFALTEPNHGSDIVKLETRAHREFDGSWTLTGRKRWIGNGTVADIVVVWARDDDGDVGAFVIEHANGAGDPEPGYAARRITGKAANRAVWQAQIELDEVRIPADHRLAGSRNWADTSRVLAKSRQTVAWEALGHAVAAYEAATTYALHREQFGRRIAGFQLIQDKLAHMLADITGMQAMCVRMSQLQQQGRAAVEHAAITKLATASGARRVCGVARDILGGNGILLDHHVARHHADIEAVYTYEGTDSVQSLIVGRAITGISAFV
ncbi:acyl-CoA dehydrogenase family protein [Pseudonocardia tropica]|uniref:Acyl-CoA dehydrogenase family protein n=1 Tax=Pseudonocardia tropica TaxID=681289 RepID=A0ABV1JXV3_9PSEU